MVYVVNKHNKPLMPTKRYGKVRRLLKSGLAVPICNNPFTIKLKYEVTNYTQDLWLGIDSGRENIGIGVSKEDGTNIFLSELKTNNKSIKKNMDNRRAFRKARHHNQRLRKQRKALRDETFFKEGNENILRTTRICKSRDISYPGMEETITCKVIKGAEAQFNNRKIKENWLTPSARQLIQMHFHAIEEVMKFLPISYIILERNVFDFQKLENQDIESWQYSKGPLYGYKDYKDYIKEQQHNRCLLCSKNLIEHYHHIKAKHKNGSNSPANIAGLCENCHTGPNGVHKNRESAEKLQTLKSGLSKKYSISLLNTIMPKLIEELSVFCNKRGITFSLTDGFETYKRREINNLPKEHSVDGYVISISDREVDKYILSDTIYIQQRFKKKSAANIQKLNQREYYAIIDNKKTLIAKNRHKAIEQEEDSLEEYITNYSLSHTKEECEQHLRELIVKPAKRTYLAHKYNKWSRIHTGDTVKYEKHNKIKGNTKSMVFIATGIDIINGHIKHGTKNKKEKFCKTIHRGCTPYITKRTIQHIARFVFLFIIFT